MLNTIRFIEFPPLALLRDTSPGVQRRVNRSPVPGDQYRWGKIKLSLPLFADIPHAAQPNPEPS
jgi:hypothetical protein